MEYVYAFGSFLVNALEFIKDLGVLALIGVFIMVGLAILGLISAKVKSGVNSTAKFKNKHGLFRIHDSSNFDVSTAFKCRISGGFTNSDPADDPNPAPADALCATDKPVAVLRFKGDTMATRREAFSRLVDEVLINKEKWGGVVVVVSSPGGGVSAYGHVYYEMLRIKNAGLYLRVCVDDVAASGGYLMSLPADCIQAAPLATVGSIGVVAELVNFHEFLKSLGIQPLTMTAGERKRTLTPMGEVTEEKKAAFQAQLASIHKQFKELVARHRKNADMTKVAEGDHWTAQESMELNLGLVDEIGTSAEYLFNLNMDRNLVYIDEKESRFNLNLMKLVTGSIDHVIMRIAERTSRIS